MKYIALLRGINVSGQKKITMKDLAKVFANMQFSEVQTYIQSGNVLFTAAAQKEEKLTDKIEQTLADTYGFEVQVVIRTGAEWQKLSKNHPFLKKGEAKSDGRYVTLLRDRADAKSLPALAPYCIAGEEFVAAGREIYLSYPAGQGKTKLTNQVIEKKLGTVATTRNWNTVLAIQDLLKK